ncbi:hypothetical protein EYF80_010316 [Liparis tanakae]|uniref:Uncharacterized protein n=1 Tax=Liparis tanakae TaxID=230148 RepID=A0A4Z2INA1_9TELE|nr:hypothetical protein EYF80_010316 [Liparis tanakae]
MPTACDTGKVFSMSHAKNKWFDEVNAGGFLNRVSMVRLSSGPPKSMLSSGGLRYSSSDVIGLLMSLGTPRFPLGSCTDSVKATRSRSASFSPKSHPYATLAEEILECAGILAFEIPFAQVDSVAFVQPCVIEAALCLNIDLRSAASSFKASLRSSLELSREMPSRLPPSSESTDPARLNPAQDPPEMEPSGISRLRLRSSNPRTFSKTFELTLASFGDGLRVNSFRENSLRGVCGRESWVLPWDSVSKSPPPPPSQGLLLAHFISPPQCTETATLRIDISIGTAARCAQTASTALLRASPTWLLAMQVYRPASLGLQSLIQSPPYSWFSMFRSSSLWYQYRQGWGSPATDTLRRMSQPVPTAAFLILRAKTGGVGVE